MRMRNGDMAVKLLDFVGLCGEVPVSLMYFTSISMYLAWKSG